MHRKLPIVARQGQESRRTVGQDCAARASLLSFKPTYDRRRHKAQLSRTGVAAPGIDQRAKVSDKNR